jgi:hypothetical protein
MDDLEMFLNIYNEWFNDAHAGSFSSSMEKTLMDENEDAIASHRLLDMDENNFRVYIKKNSFIFEVFFSLQI